MRSIAFPCISTGVFGYPVELAAKTAINTVVETLARLNCQIDVTFCCFSAGELAVYERILNQNYSLD